MTSKELFFKILKIAIENNYPDIHLNSKHKPIWRNHSWEIVMIDKIWEENSPILNDTLMLDIIKEISWEEWVKKLNEKYDLDCSYTFETWERYRINCYMDTNGYSIAMRSIPSIMPTFESLWLNDTIKNLCNKSKWLILLTWPTWSWKSTILAAMIDYINNNFNKHIITIEDPVEFSFKSNKSLINQREVWNSTKWFNESIKACLREDPDVIMIWEMRDPETIASALTLAETGHLVLSTLHTNDSVQSIDRIVDVFPNNSQKQIRMQLAMWLIWVVSQRLLPRIDREWRIPSREILVSNDAVRNLIISWKTHQLYAVLETWKKFWMILMDKYLITLYNKGFISKDTLISYIRDKDGIEMMLEQ